MCINIYFFVAFTFRRRCAVCTSTYTAVVATAAVAAACVHWLWVYAIRIYVVSRLQANFIIIIIFAYCIKFRIVQWNFGQIIIIYLCVRRCKIRGMASFLSRISYVSCSRAAFASLRIDSIRMRCDTSIHTIYYTRVAHIHIHLYTRLRYIINASKWD